MDGNGARQTLVIVGHGMTSHALCRRLAACGVTRGELRVVVIGEEPRPAYDRVHLVDLLGGKTEADLALAPASWYGENGIDLHIGDRVSMVDRDDCLVRTESGETVLFDRLVLATGSRPFLPPIEGTRLPGVFAIRSVADVQAIKTHAETAARAVVIGGGLLGVEAAHAIRQLGLDVHIAEPSPGLLPRQLDATGARIVRDRIEALGLSVHTGARVVAIEASAHSGPCPLRIVRFDNGSSASSDLVIIAAGIRPRSEIAAAAGLEIAPNGGIVVDDRLTTSDPRIFAIGECASHRGITYGLAAPGYRMVDVLVRNLAGGDAVFEGASVAARLKLAGIEVAALGLHDERMTPGAAIHVYLADRVYRKLVVADGRIIGALAVGPWDDLVRVEDAILEPRRFSFWDLRRFRGTGSLFLRSESPPVQLWPREAIVCGCFGVRRGAITDAEVAGCATVEAISARTRAGSMCGSCKPLIADYLRGDRADSMTPAAVAATEVDFGEDPPPTLRCNPDEDPPASPEGPISIRTPNLPSPPSRPRPRPAFDTLTSAASMREALAFAVDPVVLSSPIPCVESGDLVPISIAPASSIRASQHGPISVDTHAAPSSRRASMIPLAPIAVPEALLPSIPEVHVSPSLDRIASDARARRVLIASGAIAIAGACLTIALPAIPPARSFGGFGADAIVSSRAARQASGYTMIALATFGFALSLRKHVKRFAKLDLQTIRALHTALGAAMIGSLWLHTGLHLGEKSNRALMIDLLAIVSIGGAAALVTALGGADPRSLSHQSRLSRAHVVAFLPFPALLAVHVLRAYWF